MLKTTLIAHACMLIQSKKTTILTDPVWFDYLWEEINVLCPSIKLNLKQIPPIDVLNISHRHQDHFDVRTLAYLIQNESILKPNALILAPNDEILIDVLKELNYKNINIVEDFKSIKVNDVTLTPTPSLNEGDYFPEHGLLVNDGEVTIWNQVDTVVNPEIISHIHKLYGRLDFSHSRFLPLLEGNFNHHKTVAIPFDEYSSFLKVARALKPKFIVPGSAAFRYRDEYGFLNRYSFPTTPEQFLLDLGEFCPDIKTSIFNSGDIAYISKEGVKINKQSSDFVRVLADDSDKIIFKPIMEVAPIISIASDPSVINKDKKIITEFIEGVYMEKLSACDKLNGWKHWQTLYQIEVFASNGSSKSWDIDFRKNELKACKNNLRKINLYEGIASSDLIKLINGETSWDYVGLSGNYRTFNNIYRVGPGSFEFYPLDRPFPLPLLQVFPSNKEMDRKKYMKDVLRWKNYKYI
jgi:UDP-MurNAc hydroxylase